MPLLGGRVRGGFGTGWAVPNLLGSYGRGGEGSVSEEVARILRYGLAECPVRPVGANLRGHRVYLLAHGDARVLVRRAAMRSTAKGYTEARYLDAVEGLEATIDDDEGRRAAVEFAQRTLHAMPESLARTGRIIEHLEQHGPVEHLADVKRADARSRAYFAEVARLLLVAGHPLDG